LSLHPAVATCVTTAGTPYTEGTGLICRVPSTWINPSHFRLLT